MESVRLQQENYMLRAESRSLIQAMASPSICRSCNGPFTVSDIFAEKNKLELENALLRSELNTLTCFKNLFPEGTAASSDWLYAVEVMTALSLEEVASLARDETPMWTNEMLNLNAYYSKFFPWYARNAPGFVHEVSRASALVSFDASSLVTNLMDPASWLEIFPSIIAASSMESEHQDFQVINMDVMPLISPLSQSRDAKIIRRCSKHIDNETWVIADMSMYFSCYVNQLRPKFMRFPSGYLVEHIINGVSKITIIDHWVYKEDENIEEAINQFRPYLSNPNSGFAAHRWLEALQRHCYDNYIISVHPNHRLIQLFDPTYRTNLLNLSTVMVYRFCTGVCGITGQTWNRFNSVRFPANNITMFTQESRHMSGVPSVLVSATGLAIMQAKPEEIFGLINHAQKKDIWSYLQSVGNVQEKIRIKRSPNFGNEVSIFSFEGTGSRNWCMIQETYFEASEAMIIHACIQTSSLEAVIRRGDLSGVELLPCGFTIVPFGQQGCVVSAGCQVRASHDMVTSSHEVVNYLEKMLNGTLGNVRNALPIISYLR